VVAAGDHTLPLPMVFDHALATSDCRLVMPGRNTPLPVR
jgi:hypothetical protein